MVFPLYQEFGLLKLHLAHFKVLAWMYCFLVTSRGKINENTDVLIRNFNKLLKKNI